MECKCAVCGKVNDGWDSYEYRGAYSCGEHFDEMVEKRNFQRQEIIAEEDNKTKSFKGLDIDPTSTIGKANRKLLAKQIEVCGKESGRLKEYETNS